MIKYYAVRIGALILLGLGLFLVWQNPDKVGSWIDNAVDQVPTSLPGNDSIQHETEKLRGEGFQG